MQTLVKPFQIEYGEAISQVNAIIPARESEDISINLQYFRERLEHHMTTSNSDSFIKKYMGYLVISPESEIVYPMRIFNQFLKARRSTLEWMAVTKVADQFFGNLDKCASEEALSELSGDSLIEEWDKIPFDNTIKMLSETNPIDLQEKDEALFRQIVYF